jgi:hypothetical protein
MFGPIGHGFGAIAGVFAAIVWAIGSFILVLVIIALIVLLARFLWYGTKASRRYLELNGSPAPMRMSSPATTAPSTAAAPAAKTPTTTSTTKPATKPSTPPKA